jgi:hypothetical protein
MRRCSHKTRRAHLPYECKRLEAYCQMTVTYEVGGSSGGGHLDIDFYVSAGSLGRNHGPLLPYSCVHTRACPSAIAHTAGHRSRW